MSQPHFEGSVKLPFTLPKLQSSISGVETPHIGVFFILLESFGRLDVQNGLR